MTAPSVHVAKVNSIHVCLFTTSRYFHDMIFQIPNQNFFLNLEMDLLHSCFEFQTSAKDTWCRYILCVNTCLSIWCKCLLYLVQISIICKYLSSLFKDLWSVLNVNFIKCKSLPGIPGVNIYHVQICFLITQCNTLCTQCKYHVYISMFFEYLNMI